MISLTLSRQEVLSVFNSIYTDAFRKRQAPISENDIDSFFDEIGCIDVNVWENIHLVLLATKYSLFCNFLQKNGLIPNSLLGVEISTDLSSASFRSTNISSCKLNLSKLSKVDLSYSTITNSSFVESKIDEAKFSFSKISYSNFSNCNFSNSIWINSMVMGVDFTGSSFNKSNLENARFDHCNFVNADLSNCNLSNANFSGSNLTNANMERIVINKFTNFTGAKRLKNDILGWKVVDGILIQV